MALLTRKRTGEPLAEAGGVVEVAEELEALRERHAAEVAEVVERLEVARAEAAEAARVRIVEAAEAWEERAAELAEALRGTPADATEERVLSVRVPFGQPTYERVVRPVSQRLQREHRHALEVAGRLRRHAGNEDLAAERLAELVAGLSWPDDDGEG